LIWFYWFGGVMAVNLQNSIHFTPPRRILALLLAKSPQREVKTIDIHRTAFALYGNSRLYTMLIIVIAFPQTVRWLVDLAAKPG
jgi:TRAP-type mannitol/chloroaromatic compound transport system permease large subunit